MEREREGKREIHESKYLVRCGRREREREREREEKSEIHESKCVVRCGRGERERENAREREKYMRTNVQ